MSMDEDTMRAHQGAWRARCTPEGLAKQIAGLDTITADELEEYRRTSSEDWRGLTPEQRARYDAIADRVDVIQDAWVQSDEDTKYEDVDCDVWLRVLVAVLRSRDAARAEVQRLQRELTRARHAQTLADAERIAEFQKGEPWR